MHLNIEFSWSDFDPEKAFPNKFRKRLDEDGIKLSTTKDKGCMSIPIYEYTDETVTNHFIHLLYICNDYIFNAMARCRLKDIDFRWNAYFYALWIDEGFYGLSKYFLADPDDPEAQVNVDHFNMTADQYKKPKDEKFYIKFYME